MFLHLAVDSPSPHVRRTVIATLESNVSKQPQLLNRIIRESLAASLSRDKPAPSKVKDVGEETQEAPSHKQARLSAYLFAAGSISDDIDLSIRENLMAELVVLGHHSAICTTLCFGFRPSLTAITRRQIPTDMDRDLPKVSRRSSQSCDQEYR